MMMIKETQVQRLQPKGGAFWDFSGVSDAQTYLYRMYHENSKHSPHTQSIRAPKSDYQDRLKGISTPFVPSRKVAQLPTISELSPFEMLLSQALLGRRSSWDFRNSSLSDQNLLDFMSYAFGQSDEKEQTRTYPSGGRFYPVDIYLLPTQKLASRSQIMGEACAYRLEEKNTILSALHPVNLSELNRLTSASEFGLYPFDDAQFLVVLVGNTRFIEKKYNSLSYRLIYQELGHIGQNIMLVCEMMGLKSVPLGGFFEERINDYLKLEAPFQTAMYVFVVG